MDIKFTVRRKHFDARANPTTVSVKTYSTLEEVQRNEPALVVQMAAYCSNDSWCKFVTPGAEVYINKEVL